MATASCTYRSPSTLFGNILMDTVVWRVFNTVLARPEKPASGDHRYAWSVWGFLEMVFTCFPVRCTLPF